MVRITYEGRLGSEPDVREIPFVVGILADLAGSPDQPFAPLHLREFVEVGVETLDRIVAAVKPDSCSGSKTR